MPWSQVEPARYQRTIGENETFLKLIGDPGHALGREHWAINTVVSFTSTGSLAKEGLPSLLRVAWTALRFHHPSIAARDINQITLDYTIPDKDTIEEWAAKTFRVVQNKTAADFIPTIKPSAYAMMTYFPHTNQVLTHTAHWRTDGIGALQLLNDFFKIVATPNLAEAVYPWGEEVIRLAPPIEEAASIPTTLTLANESLPQRYVETFKQAAGAVGIPYTGSPTTPPVGTRSSHLVFSPQDTAAVVSICKARGLSITSAIHASVAAANHALAAPKDKEKHYTSTIRFSLRAYLPEPYNTPAYANGLYTTGWMKAVPASASWDETARAYNEEYRNGLSAEFVEAHRAYAVRLGELIKGSPAPGEDPPSDVDISSIGIAENLIQRAYGTGQRGVEVQDVSVGVETLTRQCVCFVWTFRDQINLNAVYNEAYHGEKEMAGLVATVKGVLVKELGLG